MDKIYDELFYKVKELQIIDTHEHLPGIESWRDQNVDVLGEYLSHYIAGDLISCGMPKELLAKVKDSSISLTTRWDLLEPYWESIENTGYVRALTLSIQGLYGLEGLNRNTIEKLNEAFIKSRAEKSFNKVLQEKSNIRLSILDGKEMFEWEKHHFERSLRMDYWIYPFSVEIIRFLEKISGVKMCSFDDWLEASERLLDMLLCRGIIALKCALAYHRSLYFDRVTKAEAEAEFNELISAENLNDNTKQSLKPGKKFQDYMMHYVMKLANKRKMVIQIHTGLQFQNGNLIYNSDPSLLSNLFIEYPDVDFIMFHIGYPYQHLLGALAKMFSNVYIDMCWANAISPTASTYALEEWLDTVPINKICAFGGDSTFVDIVYGYQIQARENVCRVLAKKIRIGLMDQAMALKIAKKLFYENPLKIYRLAEKL